MIRAVIFDLDGLIVDSEPVLSKAFESVICEYGKTPILNDKGIVQKVGISGRESWKLLKQKHGIEEDIDKLREKMSSAYSELIKKRLNLMPGFMELIKELKNSKIKTAVASSSRFKHIKAILSNLKIMEYFDVVVSKQFVERAKPYPDIFLETAKRLAVKPSDCVVLEDSQPGIEAAKSAGMIAIAVPNNYTKNHDFSKADKIIESLEKIDLKLINSL